MMKKLIGLGLVLLLLTGRVMAHGGGELQLSNAPVEACQASVWLNPPQPATNDILHVTVGISDETQAPVLDSTIGIEVVQTDDIVQTAQATSEQSVNRLFYEADLEPLSAGVYEVVLQLQSPNCEGDLSFPVEVNRSSNLTLYLLGIGLLGIGVFVWQRRRRGGGRVRPLPPSRLPKR